VMQMAIAGGEKQTAMSEASIAAARRRGRQRSMAQGAILLGVGILAGYLAMKRVKGKGTCDESRA
jgi:hypothetical protein